MLSKMPFSTHSWKMATHYLARGGDLKSVQGMLGIKSEKSMEIYLEMAKKAQFKMVQTLEL